MMMRKFTRIFAMRLCGDWVELYKLETPYPKFDGHFFLAFRKNRERKVLPLMTGLTEGGVKIIITLLTQLSGFELSEILTRLILMIGEKRRDPFTSFVALS